MSDSNKSVFYYQCLICKVCYATLVKVERHVKRHNNENGDGVPDTSNRTRRRGMLPIQKITITDCYIPVVKNEIDPTFLAQYETVLPKEETPSDNNNVDYSLFDHFMTSGSDEIQKSVDNNDHDHDDVSIIDAHTGRRKKRSSRVKADETIRRISAMLRRPDKFQSWSDVEDDQLEPSSDRDSSDSEQQQRPPKLRKICMKRRVNDDWEFLPPPTLTKIDVNRIGRRIKRKYVRRQPCTSNEPRRSHPQTVPSSRSKIPCTLPFCEQAFPSYFSLRSHLNLHCKAEQNEQSGSGEDHDNDHQPPPSKTRYYLADFYSCKFCLKPCGSEKKLKTHVEQSHSGLMELLKCTLCNNTADVEISGVTDFLSHFMTAHPELVDPYQDREARSRLMKEKYRKEVYRKHKCDQCSRSFWDSSSLKLHVCKTEYELKEMAERRKFACPTCNKGFTRKENMRRHFLFHLENNPFTCDFPGCGKKCNSAYNLRRHQNMHDPTKQLNARVKCPLCPRTFSDNYKVRRHLLDKHKPGDVTNPKVVQKCIRMRVNPRVPENNPGPNSNNDTSTLAVATAERDKVEGSVVPKEERIVEEIHLTDKILVKPDGDAVHVKGEELNPSSSSTQYLRPSASSSNEIAIIGKNPETGSIIRTAQNVMMDYVLSDPKVKKLCESDADQVKQLFARPYDYHIGNTFKCTECDSVFSRAWTLQLHLTSFHKKTILDITKPTQSGESVVLMCGTCAYLAKDADDLQTHMKKTHAHERSSRLKFRCQNCGRGFNQQKKLDLHFHRIHVAERPHVCKSCGKAFASKACLDVHEFKVHHPKGKLKKQCPICKGMYSFGSIKEHMKRHKRYEERRKGIMRANGFKCRLCNDNFASSSVLQRHIDCVHLGKPFNKERNRKYKTTFSNNGGGTRRQYWFDHLLHPKTVQHTTATSSKDSRSEEAVVGQDNKHEADMVHSNNEPDSLAILGL